MDGVTARALLVVAALLGGPVLLADGEEIVVLHAEPPADSPLARLVPAATRVEVTIDSNGAVADAVILQPHPFVGGLAEAAACKWRFVPDASGETRRQIITFVFAGVRDTREPSRRVISQDDPLTIRVEYLRSTIQWLPRDANGRVEPRTCPLHHSTMAVGLVPIAYGLPRSYVSNNPADRRALRRGRRFWRAEKKRFPEARTFARGGCLVGAENEAEVHYCEECRRARAEWMRRNPGDDEY